MSVSYIISHLHQREINRFQWIRWYTQTPIIHSIQIQSSIFISIGIRDRVWETVEEIVQLNGIKPRTKPKQNQNMDFTQRNLEILTFCLFGPFLSNCDSKQKEWFSFHIRTYWVNALLIDAIYDKLISNQIKKEKSIKNHRNHWKLRNDEEKQEDKWSFSKLKEFYMLIRMKSG